MLLSTAKRASLIFPFVDRLNDGHSPFRYGAPILISPNAVVLANEPGLQETYEGTFDPSCGAYAPVPGRRRRRWLGGTVMTGWKGDDQASGFPPSFKTTFAKSLAIPYPTYA